MKTVLVLAAALLVSAPAQADIASARSALFGGDPAAALRLAKGGDIPAQLALGEAYLTGRGVDRNPAAAAQWILKAAEAGSLTAQIMLAQLYQQGTGVEKDMARSTQWLEKAAVQGDAE